MPKNEQTSPRVATIAGWVLKTIKTHKLDHKSAEETWEWIAGSMSLTDLKALAASAMTQARAKPKGK